MLLKTFFQNAKLLTKSTPILPVVTKQLPSALNYGFTTNKFQEKLNKLRNQGVRVDVQQGSAMHEVLSNYGTNQFINRVYKTTGLSVTGALAVSQIAMAMHLPMGASIVGFLCSLGGFIGASRMAPTFINENKNGHNVIRSENTPMRLGLFSLGCAGLGLGAYPLFLYANAINPAILPLSIGISAAVFGSASLFAYTRKQDSLLSWGSSLYSGLLGLIGLNIAGLLTGLVMGPNLFTAMCFRAETFIGVGLFSALVAYDTHVALKAYREGYADHLGVSVDFILDFWNILTRVVQILSMFTRSD